MRWRRIAGKFPAMPKEMRLRLKKAGFGRLCYNCLDLDGWRLNPVRDWSEVGSLKPVGLRWLTEPQTAGWNSVIFIRKHLKTSHLPG
jgi:hypothetical protein